MADYEMKTFDGGSGAGDTHSGKTKTEPEVGKLRQTDIDNGYEAGTGDTQASPSQQRAGEREADGDTSVVESRAQTDDGRAHMARQTVRHDPRSDSIHSIDTLPRRQRVSPLPTIPSVSSDPGNPTESTDHDAAEFQTESEAAGEGRPHILHQVANGKPHISLCQV